MARRNVPVSADLKVIHVSAWTSALFGSLSSKLVDNGNDTSGSDHPHSYGVCDGKRTVGNRHDGCGGDERSGHRLGWAWRGRFTLAPSTGTEGLGGHEREDEDRNEKMTYGLGLIVPSGCRSF